MISKLLILLTVAILHFGCGHHILFVNLLSSTSHIIPEAGLAEGLLEKGHKVTFMLGKKFALIPPDAKQIVVAGVPDLVQTVGKPDISAFERIQLMQNAQVDTCDIVSKSKFIVDHLKTVKYDLFIFSVAFQQCAIVTFLHHQKDVPYIMYHPALPVTPWNAQTTGINTWDASYYPVPFMLATEKMNFRQRFTNMALKLLATSMVYYFNRPLNAVLTKNLGPGHKDSLEVLKNASLLFINSNFEYEYPLPVTPDVVMTGCMQCRAGRPLPPAIRNFIDAYKKEGIIVFSLGSVLPSSALGHDTTAALLDAFKELPQGVIWHTKVKIDNLPKNILLQPWLPMQDVLADPNTKAIISHGGYMTLQETIYHGVPYLGLPTLGESTDRSRNVRLAAYKEIGLFLDENVKRTKSLILESLNQLLHNPKYKKNSLYYSNLLKDQILHPRDLAVYKIEYVIRHKGSLHFKSHARNLSAIEYYMIDVAVVLVLAISIFLFICRKITKLIIQLFRKLCRKRKVKDQ